MRLIAEPESPGYLAFRSEVDLLRSENAQGQEDS